MGQRRETTEEIHRQSSRRTTAYSLEPLREEGALPWALLFRPSHPPDGRTPVGLHMLGFTLRRVANVCPSDLSHCASQSKRIHDEDTNPTDAQRVSSISASRGSHPPSLSRFKEKTRDPSNSGGEDGGAGRRGE